MDTADFAAERLFKPLGITDWHWRKDPQGLAIGGFGLYLLSRDMAKIGLLYLHRGRWDGQQVVPAAWADKVFKAKVPMQLSPGADYRYADGWWTLPARKAYMARLQPAIDPGAARTQCGGRAGRPAPLLDRPAARPHRQRREVGVGAAGEPRGGAGAASEGDGRRVGDGGRRIARFCAYARGLGPALEVRLHPLGVREMELRLDGTPSYEIVSEPVPGAAGARRVLYGLGLEGRFVRSEGPRGPVLSKALWTSEQTLALHARLLQDGHLPVAVRRPPSTGDRLFAQQWLQDAAEATGGLEDDRHLRGRRRIAAAVAAHDTVDHHHADAGDVAQLHAL